MILPKRVTVHLFPELASLLEEAKAKEPRKSLSELLGQAATQFLKSQADSNHEEFEV